MKTCKVKQEFQKQVSNKYGIFNCGEEKKIVLAESVIKDLVAQGFNISFITKSKSIK